MQRRPRPTAQIFSRSADLWLKLVLLLVGCGAVASLLFAGGIVRSDYVTGRAWITRQPVQFSHRHHVGELGIDCRYCHAEVETSMTAGYPPTETCMSCHSQLWTATEELALVRESLASGVPIRWNRVHDLPDYVYFNHSIHVSRGVGCVECHGQVDDMVFIHQAEPLTMSWCLECHRNPAPHLRPEEEVFNLHWRPPENRADLGRALLAAHDIEPGQLDSCYVCHR
jgi:hypothetical protein